MGHVAAYPDWRSPAERAAREVSSQLAVGLQGLGD